MMVTFLLNDSIGSDACLLVAALLHSMLPPAL
jgi:hypothetical protein